MREQNEGKLTALRAEYLTERLVAQIGAIQREISTTKIRKNEIKHSSYFRKPINVLYQELAQHQEWARRLREMVLEKERAVESAPSFMRADAQKVLLATEQRLARCEAALLKLENQITHREKTSIMADQPTSPLDDAPEEIKLAVDLIYLLESNEIDPEVALNALKIVQNDLENKLKAK